MVLWCRSLLSNNVYRSNRIFLSAMKITFKRIRRYFIYQILILYVMYDEASPQGQTYLCLFNSTNRILWKALGRPDWKTLLEVKKCGDSLYLRYSRRKSQSGLTCLAACFDCNSDRIAFLKECRSLTFKTYHHES
jgi:hypothetical protein